MQPNAEKRKRGIRLTFIVVQLPFTPPPDTAPGQAGTIPQRTVKDVKPGVTAKNQTP